MIENHQQFENQFSHLHEKYPCVRATMNGCAR